MDVIPGFKWFLGLIYLIFKDLQTRVVQNHFASPIEHYTKYQGAFMLAHQGCSQSHTRVRQTAPLT